MKIWQPSPGEALLSRNPVMFATGAALAVSGMRWFRNGEREDIQGELPNWPAGPGYRKRTPAGGRGKAVLGATGRVPATAVMGLLTGGGGVGGWSVPGRPDDPDDEIEDFPVIWGAPGSVARTLPWQLDPDRRSDACRTHLIVTDSRLVITGFLRTGPIEDELLWSVPRTGVAHVRTRDFSRAACADFHATKCDFVIAFTDGSWCRLASNYRDEACEYLTEPFDVLSVADLGEKQRLRLERFLGRQEMHGPPVLTRWSGDVYRIDAPISEVDWFSGVTMNSDFMGPEGEDPQDL